MRRRIWRMWVQVSAPLQGLSFLLCPGNKGRFLVIFSVGRGKSLVSPLRRCPLGTFSFQWFKLEASWNICKTWSYVRRGAGKWLLQGAHHARQEQNGLKLMSYTKTHRSLQSLRRLAHWAKCVAGMIPFNLHRWSWRRNFISRWKLRPVKKLLEGDRRGAGCALSRTWQYCLLGYHSALAKGTGGDCVSGWQARALWPSCPWWMWKEKVLANQLVPRSCFGVCEFLGSLST